MRPFKMFFGIAVGLILFFFIARVAILAFIIAGIMSIIYAVYRRMKDFITYDRYGDYYIPERRYRRSRYEIQDRVEPLFQEAYSNYPRQRRPIKNIQFIDAH